MVAMRFGRRGALDQLADALRRADATWHGGELPEWEQLAELEQQQWRDVARAAATAVCDEIAVERDRVAAG
jgi:hypothetical protein